MASLNKQIVRGDQLIPAVKEKIGLDTDKKVAEALGMSQPSLQKWKAKKSGITSRQIVNSISAARKAAKNEAHSELLRPIVEFFPLDVVLSRGGGKYELFPTIKGEDGANRQKKDLRKILEQSNGVYIFYDTRGMAAYVGKAENQSLWNELKSVFNRKRKSQEVYRVNHPERNQEFKPAHRKERQILKQQVLLGDIAAYVSVYEVDKIMINSLEALLVRGFANDLLNVRMEKFDNHKLASSAKKRSKSRSRSL